MLLSPEELALVLRAGEGSRVEFKRGLPRPERLARSLCALANTRGGLLLVGVDDDGRVVGAPRPRASAAELRRVAHEGLEPPLEVRTQELATAEGTVLACSVPLSGRRPHAVVRADGSREVVVRVGSSNRRASGAALAALRAQRRGRGGLDALEQQVLAWVGRPARGGGARTVEAFARACNVGKQRARRAFVRLERDGHLVGHGLGARRAYALP